MAENTGISWADHTVNFWHGCQKVSEACRFCYAERLDARFHPHPHPMADPGTSANWGPNAPRLLRVEAATREAFRYQRRAVKEGRRFRVFTNSMSDFFEDRRDLDEARFEAFATILRTPHLTWMILTKRPDFMAQWMSDPETPGRVAQTADRQIVAEQIAKMGPERIKPIPAFPGYFVSDRGRVFTGSGSAGCVWCGVEIPGVAKRKYCSKSCSSKAQYEASQGRFKEPAGMRPLSPDEVDGGYQRVTLKQGDARVREFVHRLVLSVFVREPSDQEQACHRDGNPSNNALPNLRWGTQSENWDDRRRHGKFRAYAKLTQRDVDLVHTLHADGATNANIASRFDVSETQVRNILDGAQWAVDAIEWPLPWVWCGTTAESQEWADKRVPELLKVPAAVRFLSCEPLLGPISFRWAPWAHQATGESYREYLERKGKVNHLESLRGLDWIIAGGESGPHARPMHPDWARSLRDQCAEAGVPFHFKQWGEWRPPEDGEEYNTAYGRGGKPPAFLVDHEDGVVRCFYPHNDSALRPDDSPCKPMIRVGVRAASRLLDGVLHDAVPEA